MSWVSDWRPKSWTKTILAAQHRCQQCIIPKTSVAVTAYVFSQMGDIRFTQGKTSMSRRPNRTRTHRNRCFMLYILDASRFTASHYGIYVNGRGQARNVNSRRYYDEHWRLCTAYVDKSFAVIRMGSTGDPSSVVKTEAGSSASTNIEVYLSFNHRQPIRFSITNAPLHNDAWVGLYEVNAEDRNHGDNWHYLRDIDVNNANIPWPRKRVLEYPCLHRWGLRH